MLWKKILSVGVGILAWGCLSGGMAEAKRNVFEMIKTDVKADISNSENITGEKEPNDDLLSPQTLELGAVIKGRINKKEDMDVYHFTVVSNKREVIMITLDNTAAKLSPHIVAYNYNREPVGYIASQRAGVSTLRAKMTVKPNEEYLIQIFSSRSVFGLKYALKKLDEIKSSKPYFLEVRKATAEDGILIDKYEPNDDLLQPTSLELNTSVKGTIEPMLDVDYYKFHLASNKKEEIEIKVLNQAKNIAPNIIVYDENREELGWRGTEKGAAAVEAKLVAQPNQDYFIAVFSSTIGVNAKYALEERHKERSDKYYSLEAKLVTTAADKYEPNDDLLKATQVSIGEIKGTINPPWDIDCYKFKAPRSGKMHIQLLNPTLEITPRFIVYNSERIEIGTATTKQKGAAKVEMRGNIKAGREYYVKIYSGGLYDSKPDDACSDKEYTLKIEIK